MRSSNLLVLTVAIMNTSKMVKGQFACAVPGLWQSSWLPEKAPQHIYMLMPLNFDHR